MARGFSLVELLIVAAVTTLFFGGLFLTIQKSLQLVTESRARMTAISVANDQMEYIRSLAYDAVGTVSGLPPGLLPQVSTTTLNGIEFTRRILVEYVDDPADGVGVADTNTITTDYKRAKVTISWERFGAFHEVFLVSNVVPRSIETNAGGGTVRVNVFDAALAPLPGASVRLLNTSGTSTVDVTRTTDATGVALFGGAPAGGGYEIFVSRAGYSSDQTYAATTTLPNPAKLPVAVAVADVSTADFFIDEVSEVSLRLLADRVEERVVLTMASSSDISTSTDLAVEGGALRLTDTAGVYVAAGNAALAVVAPATVARWDEIVVTETTPLQTTRRLSVYTGTTTDTLVPDGDLPGNSSGFTLSTIEISALDPVVYPALTIGLTLETTNSSVSPAVTAVTVFYIANETPLASAAVTLTGTKTIGTQLDASPVYKYSSTDSTDADGVLVVPELEWDAYTVAAGARTVASACAAYPLVVEPGTAVTSTLLMVPTTAHGLRVAVWSASGPIRDAVVALERGASVERVTDGCGQVHFDDLTAAGDYVLTVTAAGYTPVVLDPLNISGQQVQQITL